jgi:GH35 family endo-1,4-beta-xylanase
MKKYLILIFVLSVVIISCIPIHAQDTPNWKVEADARIEQIRKEDVEIQVTHNGKPVSGAKVEVDMQTHEFLFGCQIFGWGNWQTEEENEAYKRRFAAIFNFATLGFYWKYYEPVEGKPNYAYSEQVAAWCAENGIKTKGHMLAWNRIPEWLNTLSPETMLQRQRDRVGECTAHFRGKIDAWEVVNEFSEWSDKQSWEHAPKLVEAVDKYGKTKFINDCFTEARKANPEAMLLINDLDDRYEKLLEQIIEANNGKPLFDVVGVQSHMHAGIWDNQKIVSVCETFSKSNVPVHFTELTILSHTQKVGWDYLPLETNEEGERYQQDNLIRIYTMLFSHPSVEAITWWDLCDKEAWRDVPGGLLRKDFSPKPAYEALERLVKKEWATHETVITGKSGAATLRAFRGKYHFTITLPNGKKIEKIFDGAVGKGSNKISLNID